ncbi:MAG: S41 family peptidase [Phycisphaerales bacterium]
MRTSVRMIAGAAIGIAIAMACAGGVVARGAHARAAPAQGAGTPAPTPAPLTATTLLPAAGLRADAALLRRAYEALHPGLRRSLTPEQLDAAFAALDAAFARDRTLADAYLAFSQFAAKIRCGHTYANFFNQPEAIAAALFRAPRLPFEFRWLGDRMIVTRSDAGVDALAPGTEVLAIDGVPVREILAKLMTVARADGGNDDKRRALLERRGTERIETFDVFFPLLFPPRGPRFELTLRPRENAPGMPGIFSVAAVPWEQAEAAGAARQPKPAPDAPAFELRSAGRQIGLLRMPDWAFYNTRWDWRGGLRGIFDELVRTRATDLIIDLRGNEGGSDVGDVLAAHLTDTPLARPAVVRKTRYRAIPADLRPYLDTWDRSFDDWGAAATPAADGFFTLRRDADDDPGGTIAPEAPHFAGRVWVIVGPENSSATFEFARLVQANRLGTLVGRPTGGNLRGINGGCFYFLRLPNSKIELDLPLIGQFPLDPAPDGGIQPDMRVEPSAEDIAAGRDPEFTAVLARIRTLGPPKPVTGPRTAQPRDP